MRSWRDDFPPQGDDTPQGRRRSWPFGIRLGTLTLLAAACSSPQPAGDADAGSDPRCIAGHDPDFPSLWLVDLYAYRPLVLQRHPAAGQIFGQILSSTPLLFAFESLDDEAGASLAIGTATNDHEIYAFDAALPPPTRASVWVDGTSFESEPVDVILRGDMTGLKEPVDLHLHDAVAAGVFTTPERCSIGQAKATPGWRLDATLRGTLTVAETNDTEIQYGEQTYVLCQFLSGIFVNHDSGVRCDDVEISEWLHPPDTMIPDGEGGMEPAWVVDVDFAATAVRMAGREP